VSGLLPQGRTRSWLLGPMLLLASFLASCSSPSIGPVGDTPTLTVNIDSAGAISDARHGVHLNMVVDAKSAIDYSWSLSAPGIGTSTDQPGTYSVQVAVYECADSCKTGQGAPGGATTHLGNCRRGADFSGDQDRAIQVTIDQSGSCTISEPS